jgi:pimeloyl-ACP methyl ester carboxylesterase
MTTVDRLGDRLRLVFVHGIGAPMRPDSMREEWLGALTSGMAHAGHGDVAELLRSAAVDVVMAHYAPLYVQRGAQGPGCEEPDGEETDLMHALVAEMIDEAAQRPLGVREQAIVARARLQLDPPGQPQGAGLAARTCVNALTTLAALPGLASLGRWASDLLLIADLRQVTRYLRRGEPDAAGVTLDQRIRNRVTEAIGSGPAIVVAHSLGTVVAVEALHETKAEVPLLVTFGSPLAMRTVVLPRLRPTPPRTAPTVARWLNVWDKDDPIVARPLLEKDVEPNASGVRPEDFPIQSAGSWVHPARLYLQQPGLAGPIASLLRVADPARTG